jgi:5-methylcytosine-specific restriction endonuclease McrA
LLTLSKRFQDRINSLFGSQQNRAREKRGPSGRLSKAGYVLPFDKKQFAAWFLDQFSGNEFSVIRCKYCNKPVDAYSCVVDHEIPLKRGGSPGLQNLGLPCEPCNQIKGGMTPDEFRFFLATLQQMALRFHGGQAVQDITSRLQKAIKLAAAVRFSMSRKRQQVAPVAEEEF